MNGVTSLVPAKGPVQNIIDKITQGLQSGCSYQGASNLSQLKDSPEFVEISNNGLIESHPHNVKVL